MEKLVKDAGEAVTKVTQPIENEIHKATNNKLKEVGDQISKATTGEPWREGAANKVREVGLTAVGGKVGGPEGAPLAGAAAKILENKPKTEEEKKAEEEEEKKKQQEA